MKKHLLTYCLFILLSGAVFAQVPAPMVYMGQVDSTFLPRVNPHHQEEYTFDVTVNPSRWNLEKPGLHAAFTSTDNVYYRSEAPEINASQNDANSWQATVWRGERLNVQVLTWSPDTINQIHFKLTDLKSEGGKLLKKDNIKLNMIRYVLSGEPYISPNTNCGSTPGNKAYLLPDRFEEFERFDLPGRTVRPVWLSVDVPSDTKPGLYKGTVEVRSEKGNAVLSLAINVQKQVLPKPSQWKFRLDLWQNPWVIASYYNLKPWSDEHMALLKKHMKLYAQAGGTYITTYAVHSPWADNSYRIEGSMIEWIKRTDGSWKFDYTIFDKYVGLAMEAGITKAITIYTPIPWGNRFRYLDEKTDNNVYVSWAPESKEFKEVWNVFLNDLKSHLKKKGWLERTYLGINENEMNQTLAAIKVIRENSPDWKITYAGDWHPELDGLLNDYCTVYGKEPAMTDVQKRSKAGSTTTYYVCCVPAKPNNFLSSPPAEGRWQGWYTAAYGYNGFLRWAYDAWPADPQRDARHVYWPSGDCFLVYPGGNSSIRFEKLREGIVDFEKITLLRDMAEKSKDKNVRELSEKLEEHLKTFTTERDFKEEAVRNSLNEGKKLLDELSDKVN